LYFEVIDTSEDDGGTLNFPLTAHFWNGECFQAIERKSKTEAIVGNRNLERREKVSAEHTRQTCSRMALA
jgi:hypothetical protein